MEDLPSISYYVWQTPEAAITVQISLEVIERIRALIARDPAGAAGVLRGAVLPSGAGTVLVVDDFEPAAGEARLAACAGLPSVVGRWRAHTGKPLAPLETDLSEMALYFPQPWKVLLLVGAEEGEYPAAGFFTWSNGVLASKCLHEFPFHSGALLAAGAPVVEGPQRSRPLELRKGHGWRASALSAIIAAIALAGGTWYWHRPVPPATPKQPPAVLASQQPAGAAVALPVAPTVAVPLPDLSRPSAMPRPAAPAPVAPARASRPAIAKASRHDTGRQDRAREEDDIAEPVTRHFFQPSAAAQPAPAAATNTSGTAQRAQDPAPLRKATVAIAEARPAKSARGTFLPPLPVLAARPEVHGGGCPCDTPVDIRVRVDETGAVTAVEPTPGTPENELTSAALAAARQWSFVAARDGTRKVASEVVLRFRFPIRADSYISRK